MVSWTSPLILISLSFDFFVSIVMGFFLHSRAIAALSTIRTWIILHYLYRTNKMLTRQTDEQAFVLMTITRVQYDYYARPCDKSRPRPSVIPCTLTLSPTAVLSFSVQLKLITLSLLFPLMKLINFLLEK